ncbi:hypothetical protein AGLY_002422 [Aphis glycines]|uniref:Uncharacterized protein n=1 Tax=Aphis glycines TaxID=307491 RepID=A0A6G0U5R2_APHGL|nr:hypothetical protein AGLY_002422 [Aphis glycines]
MDPLKTEKQYIIINKKFTWTPLNKSWLRHCDTLLQTFMTIYFYLLSLLKIVINQNIQQILIINSRHNTNDQIKIDIRRRLVYAICIQHQKLKIFTSYFKFEKLPTVLTDGSFCKSKTEGRERRPQPTRTVLLREIRTTLFCNEISGFSELSEAPTQIVEIIFVESIALKNIIHVLKIISMG